MKLDFSNYSALTLETLPSLENEESPSQFDIVTSSVGNLSVGKLVMYGAGSEGSAVTPGVLHRFSPVNINMFKKYRPETASALRDFEIWHSKGDPHIEQDSEGFYITSIRWATGWNTPDLAQVTTKKPNENRWKTHFL